MATVPTQPVTTGFQCVFPKDNRSGTIELGLAWSYFHRRPATSKCTERGYLIMVQLTETAVGKVREILSTQEPQPAGLRISVVGGGCSGFSYSMAFENSPGFLDKTYAFGDLKVFIDQASMLYLDGAEVDYVESLEGQGF